jgi:CubicO group peptidase (beta-lactamase class C family)
MLPMTFFRTASPFIRYSLLAFGVTLGFSLVHANEIFLREGASNSGFFLSQVSSLNKQSEKQHYQKVYAKNKAKYDSIMKELPAFQKKKKIKEVKASLELFPGARGNLIKQWKKLFKAAQRGQWKKVGSFSNPNFLDTPEKAKSFFGPLKDCAGIAETHLNNQANNIVLRVVNKDGGTFAYSLWWTRGSKPLIAGAYLGGPDSANKDIIAAATHEITTSFMKKNKVKFDKNWNLVSQFGEKPIRLNGSKNKIISLPSPPGAKKSLVIFDRKVKLLDISPLIGRALEEHNRTAKEKVPGVSVAVISAKGSAYAGFAGLRRSDRPDVPIESLKEGWHLGSNTKSMSATLYATEIVAKGLGTFDTTMAEIFPDYASSMKGGFKNVTVRQLMRHESGMPFMPPRELGNKDRSAGLALGWDTSLDPHEKRKAILKAYFEHYGPSYKPGVSRTYSNWAYTVLGHVSESLISKHEKKHTTYEELLQKRFFSEIGINISWVGPPGKQGQLLHPRGHSGGSGLGIPREPPADNPPYLTPAGRMSLTTIDHLKYGAFHLEAREGLHSNLVSKDIITEMQNNSSVSHDGSNTMWKSRIIVDYSNKKVIVMETNHPAGTDILMRLTRILDAFARSEI